MEAIKNFLKPGDKNDNDTLYDTGADPNKGKISGEGSHFGHGHSDSGVGGVNSPTSTTNPTSGLTGSSATKTAEPSSTTSGLAGEQAPIGTAVTTTGDRAFPLSDTNQTTSAAPSTLTSQPTTTSAANTSNSTSTSTAALPVAAASSGVQEGTAPHGQSQISSANAQGIISPTQPTDDNCTDLLHGGPHVTQIARKIDPCYEDQDTTGVPSTIGSANSTSHSAALVPDVTSFRTGAGTSTTGLASEVPREPRGTASTVDSTAFGSNATSGNPTAGVTGSSATRTADPVANTSSQHDSSLAGPAALGAGAGLAGASAAGAHHESGQTSVDNNVGRPSASTTTTVPTTASSGVAATTSEATTSAAHPYSEKAVDPRIDSGNTAAAGTTRTLDPAAEQRAAPVSEGQGHHYARDAAIGGAAGAGAGALADHEYSKKEAEKEVKEQKALEKEHEKEVKQAEKEHEKEVKHAEKEQAKAEKQHEKEVKQHEKELEKERKQQEKAEKPGLIDRLLHRGDAKKDSHAGEDAAAGAAAGAGAGAIHEHNKLHKDPPAGYAAEPTKGYASQVTGGTGTTALAQGNENILPSSAGDYAGPAVPGTRYGSGNDEHSQPEYYQNNPELGIKHDSVSAAGGTVSTTTPYLPAPQKGYASQVTGGTGTTQLAEGNLDPVTNPTKSNPLDQGKYGPQGYAATVTGGTGTTELAHGTESHIPTTGMVPGRSGSVAGVTTETPYVDGPKAGTGKYADQVTGGTGTTQLAQGHEDEIANPHQKSLTDKLEEALVLK